jgi:hypothetical protein
MIKLENTKKFYDEIKNMGFFTRVFSWGKIINLLTESYSEIKKIEDIAQEINDLKSQIKVKEEKINSLNDKFNSSENKITILESKKDDLIKDIKDLSNKLSQFEKVKDEQQKKYDESISKLEKREETLELRREELENQQVENEKLKFEEMTKTWKNHETNVEQNIKNICNKYCIDYFDKEKVPFKGKPDNCIKIADEFIIFDAKSPQKDDLTNFPKYIKSQTDAVDKYIKEENVKKDLYLVIPTNAIDSIETTFYDKSNYRVFIITLDALEPIILSLKKIEDYEFAEKLSPEDRESICRIIGHFAHHTKRRLQIDTFLGEKAIELLKNCEYLPEDVLENVKSHETKTMLNLPMDKRVKKSNLKKLSDGNTKLKKELEIQNVNTNIKKNQIENIDLYNKNKKIK